MTTSPVLREADPAAQERAHLLQELQLMDSTPDPEFDDLVALATTICGTPMGAVTLLDETTQLTKARVGLRGSCTLPADQSMCQFTVRGKDLLMVDDLDAAPAFDASRGWREEAGIRFYAGMPLLSDCGTSLGTLCVMDHQPTTLTAEQQHALQILGRQVSHLIQARQHARAMERMAAERDREQQMFDLILNHVPVSIYLKDQTGHLRFYNRALADRFKIDRNAWLGKTSYDLWNRELADQITQNEAAVLQTGTTHVSFVNVPEPDGSISHWKTYTMHCLNADGEPMLAGSAIDLTEQMRREAELEQTRDQLKDANQKLNSLALTDALTGLWNRRAFDARLETSVIAAKRHKRSLTLMLLDADHFKSVNDRFGHPYGDSVLKEIAALLNRCKRAEDVACRFGGEEFAVLLPDTDLASARHLADRMLRATRDHAWEKTPVTVSIGLAACSDACTSDDLVDHADAALYHAKRNGRNRVVLHGEEM